MHKIITTTVILFLALNLFAQRPAQQTEGGAPRPAGGKMPSIGRVFGKLIDAKTKQPVAFASVVIVKTLGQKDSLVSGGLSEDNGDFNVTSLPVGNLKLKITFVGYKNLEKTFKLVPEDMEEDAGNLKLEADAELLKGVEITAEKTQTVLSLEKRVFNVDKNLSATGGTAEDVLKNVPSVTVDADGSVKLRNGSPTIFIDGKPTMLAINQIPADQIEFVEVISNPSAKYDASTTGGILNLVLKKNRKAGYNGNIGLAVSTPTRYNANINANLNSGKWAFGFNYNLNAEQRPVTGYTYRTTRDMKGIDSSFFNQNTTANFQNLFQNVHFNTDYNVDVRNTVTLGVNFVAGKFNVNTDQLYNYLGYNHDTTSFGDRQTTPRNSFNNIGAELGWKKSYVKKGEALVFSAVYNHNWSSNAAQWYTAEFTNKGIPVIHYPETDSIDGSSTGNQLTAQLDFTNPLNDSTKLEMGLRSYTNWRTQNYYFFAHQSDAIGYSVNNTLSQVTDITETVNAAYLLYSSKLKHNFNYQVGLRFEQSSLAGINFLLPDALKNFGYNYPANKNSIWNTFFPSFSFGQKINENTEWGFNFSRKIQRPGWMQLSAGVRGNDRQNIQIGNPNLQPEFVNKMELGLNKTTGALTWLSTLYYEIETNSIKPLATPSKTDPNLLITQFVNGAHDNRYGWDNTLKIAATKNFDITAGFNVFNINIAVDTFNKTSWSYNGKLGMTYKFPASITAQLNANYESQQADVQGYRKAQAFADFSVKKSFFHNAASLIFSVNDIFDSRKQVVVYEFPNYTQELMRRRETRNFRIALQIPFGKVDANMFKKGKGKKPQENGDQNGQDF